MEKRVKRLELDIAPNSWDMVLPRPLSYNLPSLSPGAPLTSLQLNFVDVTGEVLEKLLHDYPTLEFVSVVSSRSLVNLKVAGPDLNLKLLQLRHCLKMEHLEITAPNLISFDYAGPFVLGWDFISTPKLAELSIGGMYCSHILENFMDFSSIFSQIEVLSIEAEDPLFPLMNGFSSKFPVGRRLKMLDISFSVKFEYDLFFIVDLLLACPLLQKFVLQGSTVECKDLSNDESTKMLKYWDIRDNEACPHECLKIVEMNKFGGTEAELRFVEYLTKRAFSVENIIMKIDCRGEEP